MHKLLQPQMGGSGRRKRSRNDLNNRISRKIQRCFSVGDDYGTDNVFDLRLRTRSLDDFSEYSCQKCSQTAILKKWEDNCRKGEKPCRTSNDSDDKDGENDESEATEEECESVGVSVEADARQKKYRCTKAVEYLAIEHGTVLEIMMWLPLVVMALYLVLYEQGSLIVAKQL